MSHTNEESEMMEILKSHGIRMSVSSCGCCSSPWVSFEYNGKLILDDESDCIFDMFDKCDDE